MAHASEERYDVIVIGAGAVSRRCVIPATNKCKTPGLAGMVAAQRYLDAHPTSRVAILEKGHCVGGVFGGERLYPGFHTQWTIGLSEFSELPMVRPPQEDCIGDSYKAKYSMQYLEEYAAKMTHNGTTLNERVKFGMRVESVKKVEGIWHIECMLDGEKSTFFSAEKMMVATGAFDRPYIPQFQNREAFKAPIIHSADFGASNILSDPDTKRVTIVGAGKSAADILYESIREGKKVTWIVREPGFFAPTDLPSPYANVLEASQTRAMSFLQPSVLHEDGWWVWFLHRTWIGIALVNLIFGLVDKEAKKRANYHGRPEVKNFEKLEYSPSIFWQNNTGGALHHDDFWDLIAENVSINRAAIISLSDHKIHLDNGEEILCDALLLGTGWKSSLNFFSEDLATSLGLPHDPTLDTPKERTRWQTMEAEGDAAIIKRFPILASPPPHTLKRVSTTPYRLYHGIAPVSDSSIVFINSLIAGNMLFNAEIQAMWAVAYFDNNVRLPPPDDMERDIAAKVAYMKRRYLSNGQLGNYMVFDMIPYADKLMSEMGVTKVWGKSWGKNAFGVYRPEDVGRAWKEYLKRNKGRLL
ncbi:FAD/NAD(P)-binding domain-containing protein [Byssothecium circinans]|uniref:L-ornithine N(5)-monooxygenase [NAD(P)H] n=1 Tax=Byssothecium circinans TaxID=147558 RepID=A0A6A5UHB7_9PLEO|nr:FAD/NAD(P)-binding domain-containing protein [Byssothecium circinans]